MVLTALEREAKNQAYASFLKNFLLTRKLIGTEWTPFFSEIKHPLIIRRGISQPPLRAMEGPILLGKPLEDLLLPFTCSFGSPSSPQKHPSIKRATEPSGKGRE